MTDISVAKAVFTSALLRSDPSAPDISRDNATLFAKALLKTANVCTNSDIKACKSFIIKNVLPSSARTAALHKYILSLAKACVPGSGNGSSTGGLGKADENEGLGTMIHGRITKPPEAPRKRLHILYIVHDVLCHLYGRLRDDTHFGKVKINFEPVEQHLKPCALSLAELAACDDNNGVGELTTRTAATTGSTHAAVGRLIDSWVKLGAFDPVAIAELRTNVDAAHIVSWDVLIRKMNKIADEKDAEERKRLEDETKWILPKRHGVVGDSNAPWHELPAANGLYQGKTAGFPLTVARLPYGGHEVKDGGKEADEELKTEVLAVVDEVNSFFVKYTDQAAVADVDALGNKIWRDSTARKTRNYWGWSYDGVEKRRRVVAADRARVEAKKARGEIPMFPPSDTRSEVARARALAAGGGAGRGFGGGSGRGAFGGPGAFGNGFGGGYGRGGGSVSNRGRGWRGGRW